MNTTAYSQESVFNSFIKRILTLVRFLKAGQFAVIWQEFCKRLYSESLSVGLRRDLMEEFDPPNAAVDISIRPLQKSSDAVILEDVDIAQKFPKVVHERKELLKAQIPQCYVAVTEKDNPCYMQWLISPQHNHLVESFFGDSFPLLNSNEALLEGAFMSFAFRGKGIMPAAMSRIAGEAKKLGVRWVLTFVDIKNIPSLKGCHRSGFSPYILKKDKWFLFQREVTFSSINEEVLEKYQDITGGR